MKAHVFLKTLGAALITGAMMLSGPLAAGAQTLTTPTIAPAVPGMTLDSFWVVKGPGQFVNPEYVALGMEVQAAFQVSAPAASDLMTTTYQEMSYGGSAPSLEQLAEVLGVPAPSPVQIGIVTGQLLAAGGHIG